MEEVRKLKVGFVGAGGTGKSSVAKILAADITIPEEFRPSIVRDVFNRLGYGSEIDQFKMNDAAAWELQREILEEKFELDKTTASGVFDRTPVDHMAYALYRCGNIIEDHELDWIQMSCWSYTSKYDLLFFFPVYDWEIADDGFRQNNKAYRIATQSIMLGLLTEYNAKYTVMENTEPGARAQIIKAKMDRERARYGTV